MYFINHIFNDNNNLRIQAKKILYKLSQLKVKIKVKGLIIFPVYVIINHDIILIKNSIPLFDSS